MLDCAGATTVATVHPTSHMQKRGVAGIALARLDDISPKADPANKRLQDMYRTVV
jgi:hypothetical protein